MVARNNNGANYFSVLFVVCHSLLTDNVHQLTKHIYESSRDWRCTQATLERPKKGIIIWRSQRGDLQSDDGVRRFEHFLQLNKIRTLWYWPIVSVRLCSGGVKQRHNILFSIISCVSQSTNRQCI